MLYGDVTEQKNTELWSNPLIWAISGGALFLLVYSCTTKNPVSSIGISLLIAAASLATGAILGFLFGIPKVIQDQSAQPQASGNGSNPEVGYLINTNLEQISDWLTKIIVGLGLINLEKVPDHIMSISAYLASGFIPSAPGSIVAAAITYFSACGFLTCYLWTRLSLTVEFSRVERAAQETPEYAEGIIHALLYQPPPTGFQHAIRFGEKYIGRFGEANYRVWTYLACAHAQKHAYLRVTKAGQTELDESKKKTLDAIERALQINPGERDSLRNLWIKGGASQEDDLSEFADDEEFKKFLDLSKNQTPQVGEPVPAVTHATHPAPAPEPAARTPTESRQ